MKRILNRRNGGVDIEFKRYKIPLDKVTVIGSSSYFEDTDVFKYSVCEDSFIGCFRGKMEVKNRKSHKPFKSKKEAILKATQYYGDNKEFDNGEIPFEIVFHHRGFGWCILSSNTISNDFFIREQLAKVR